MVQMKGRGKMRAVIENKDFISHMVQMKDGMLLQMSLQCFLYIPHGSDESTEVMGFRVMRMSLYIPHGSDERKILKGGEEK